MFRTHKMVVQAYWLGFFVGISIGAVLGAALVLLELSLAGW